MKEMDKTKQGILLMEIQPYIADVGMVDIAKQKVGRKRTGCILDALCNIVSMSPMGNINGAPHYYNGRYYEKMEWSEILAREIAQREEAQRTIHASEEDSARRSSGWRLFKPRGGGS